MTHSSVDRALAITRLMATRSEPQPTIVSRCKPKKAEGGGMEAGTSETGLIKSDQFQNFVRHNAPVLRQIFSEPEVNSMRAIADDLQRSNRSITAVKLPGGSNTAQDQASRQLSLLSKIIHHGRDTAAGAMAGFGATAPFGLGPIGAFAGTIGGSVVTAMRDAGMQRVDDLIRDATLDPQLARKLLAKGPESGAKARQISLAQYLRRNSAAALSGQKSNREEFPDAPRQMAVAK